MCVRAHHFIVRMEVYSSTIVSLCCCDRWEAGESDAPKVEKVLPHFFPNGISVHLRVDFQELLTIIGEFRPRHRHLQVSIVRVAVEVFKDRSVCKSVPPDCERPVPSHARCVTQFLQSLSSRQSCSRKGPSACPRKPTRRQTVGRKRTAHRQNGRPPPSRGRVCLVLPLNWAQTASKSRYEQTWQKKKNNPTALCYRLLSESSCRVFLSHYQVMELWSRSRTS